MSKLYATIDSDARKTKATSRGHREIVTHAASWSGAVQTRVWIDNDGNTRYSVDLVPWHSAGRREHVASGMLNEVETC